VVEDTKRGYEEGIRIREMNEGRLKGTEDLI